jgi:hypothetical protein
VQWAVWEALRDVEAAGRIVSYRKLAVAANATIRGVRDALAVIEKEGGIRSKATVRTADEQGLRIEIDPSRQFKKASLEETKGLLRRGDDYRQTVYRKSSALPSDGLRLSVFNNIKQTDMGRLLRSTPAEWKIRERTLTEIAKVFPDMTTIEFRRSLMHLVEQAKSSGQPIQNHNAWLKAAFEKNEGPIVTENMIEAQIDQVAKTGKGEIVKHEQETIQADFDVLRGYLAASSEEKAAIDQAAEERAARALSMVTSAEKRSEIIEHARLECAREFFAEAAKRR